MKVTIDENYNDETLLKDWHPKVKKNFAALKSGLETGVIITAQIPDKGVTTAKIADYAVGTTQIAQGAINNTRILNGAVNTRTIEDGSITGAKIAGKSISDSHLADKTITGTKIADKTIDTNHLADGLITRDKISDTAVTGKHIADKSITGKNIADHTLDLDKFYSDIIPVIKNGFLAESDTKQSFDDVDNDGAWYRVLNPVSNVPDTTKNEEGWVHYACCNIRFDIDYRLQIAVNVASHKMFVRNKQPDAGWSTWMNVADLMSDGSVTKSKLAADVSTWINGLLSGKVDKTQYASVSQAGIVQLQSTSGGKNNSGLVIDANGKIYIGTDANKGLYRTAGGQVVTSAADEADIDAATNSYKPIVPSKLNYAVRSVMGNNLWGDVYNLSDWGIDGNSGYFAVPDIPLGTLFYLYNDTYMDQYGILYENDDVGYELSKTIAEGEYALCAVTSKSVNQKPDMLVNGNILVIATGATRGTVLEQAFSGVNSGTANGICYAICEDGANTAEKIATVVSGQFELKNGVAVNVKFMKGINAVKSTLNINGTGAKNITYNGIDGLDCLDYGSPLSMDGIVNLVYDEDKDQYTAVQLDNNDTANFSAYEIKQLKNKVTELENRLTALEQKAITAE